jgi:diguanylate cyclase (GGDEF)-like protein
MNKRPEAARPDWKRISRTATPVLGVLVKEAATRRILVVEDDTVLSEVLRAVLEEHGYEVESVGRGGEAVERARQAPPALLILDLGLPDRDGFTVARELGQDRRTAAIPVLFLSGRADLARQVRVCNDLSGDFLRKPYGEEELLTRVERCLADADSRARLLSDARIDDLTGLGNARLLDERLLVESARRDRYGTPLTVAVIDVDRLKQINDAHGHLTGSAVLRALGKVIREAIRETDVAFRYGGDEFVVLLPHTELRDGVAFCDRLIGRIRVLHPAALPVSVSIGVAGCQEPGDGPVPLLLARADAAAYAAKRAGGDRVVTDDRRG